MNGAGQDKNRDQRRVPLREIEFRTSRSGGPVART